MQSITFAVAALLYGADAVMLQREPLLANEDFFVTAAPVAKPLRENWPKGYAVPNFGADFDVISTQKHIKDQEELQKHELIVDRMLATSDHPVDYTVPDFGLDSDIKSTQKNLADTEKILGKWTPELVQLEEQREPLLSNSGHFVTAAPVPKKAKETWPMGYAVPNFGVDRDVIATQKHIKDQELRLKHKYTPDSLKPPAGIPRDYAVPNFGMDADIVGTQKHLKQAEKKLGPWNINQLMLEEFVAIDLE